MCLFNINEGAEIWECVKKRVSLYLAPATEIVLKKRISERILGHRMSIILFLTIIHVDDRTRIFFCQN